MTSRPIGCHLSVANGYAAMARAAESIGGTCFQFFMTNPRGSRSKTISARDAAELRTWLGSNGPILCHAPYTLNPCSDKESVREFARSVMARDLSIMDEFFPDNLYNFHPGCHVRQGTSEALSMIVSLLDEVLPKVTSTDVLLETMSGKGTEVGSSFQELGEILRRVSNSARLGVCLDTCHIYSAGYDLKNAPTALLDEFDRLIGLDRLKALHVNDSLTPFASRKDRHAKLGEGSLGFEKLVEFLNDPRICRLPIYLETPNDLDGYAQEIRQLKAALI